MGNAIISAAAAIPGAIIGASGVVWKGVSDTKSARAKEVATVRRRYLEPLRIASLDVRAHFEHIVRAFDDGDVDEISFFKRTFLHIKDLDRTTSPSQFELWCNGEGYFAAATLYRTAVYCWAAERVKRELLFIDVEEVGDEPLLKRLEQVRDALGGRYGIWQSIQDSVGSCVKEPDGEVIPYRKFCRQLSDPEGYVWLLRVIDFFMDVDKPAQQGVIRAMIRALHELEKSLPA